MICRYLTDTGHLSAERTLFIDDNGASIGAALTLGWHGFCMNASGKPAAFIAE